MFQRLASICTVSMLIVCFFITSAIAQTEQWTNFGGRMNIGGGWFDWVQNDVDGRYCLETFRGHIECWDAPTNTIETVYVYDAPAVENGLVPRRGDLQSWVWDHVAQEYLHLDGCRSGRGAFAFHLPTRTWRPITDSDFTWISTRTTICGDGSAVSLDHNIAVIVSGRGGTVGRQTRILDFQARTYTEFNAPIAMIPRSYTQQQFVYIPTLQKFLMFGGRKSGTSGNLNDLWLLDPVTRLWEEVAHLNPPSPRYFGQMAYDSADNRVYLTGGHGGDSRIARLDLTTWTWEHFPTPVGVQFIDFPGWRRVGASVIDPLRGWCHVGGVLVGGDWTKTQHVWCVQAEKP